MKSFVLLTGARRRFDEESSRPRSWGSPPLNFYRGEASRISPAAFEAVHAPVGNTHGTKRLAKPTQLQQHGARDPLKKWRYSVATMKTLHNHP